MCAMGVAMLRMKDIITTVVLKPMNVVSNHRINVSDVVVVVFLLAILMKLLIS